MTTSTATATKTIPHTQIPHTQSTPPPHSQQPTVDKENSYTDHTTSLHELLKQQMKSVLNSLENEIKSHSYYHEQICQLHKYAIDIIITN